MTTKNTNQEYYHLSCCCKVKIQHLMPRYKKLPNGKRILSSICPKHMDGLFRLKERMCMDCENIVYQDGYGPGYSVAKRCPSCTIIHDRKYANKRHAERKEEEKEMLEAESAKPEKGVFKSPVAARSLTQAIIKRVRCIPCKGLFEFNRGIREM